MPNPMYPPPSTPENPVVVSDPVPTASGIPPTTLTYGNSTTPLYVRADRAVVESPLVITSPDKNDTLTLTMPDNGEASIVNDAFLGKLAIQAQSDISITSSLGNVNITGDDVNLKQLNPTGLLRGNIYLDIEAEDNMRLQSANVLDISGGAVQIESTANIPITTGSVILKAPDGTTGITTNVNNVSGNGYVNCAGTYNVSAPAVYLTAPAISLKSDLGVPGSPATGVSILANTTGANTALLLQNNNTTPAGYEMVVGGTTAGGITEGHLQVFSYSGGTYQAQLLDFSNDGTNANIINSLNVGKSGSNYVITPVSAPTGSGNLQIQASQQFYKFNDTFDLIGMGYNHFNCLMYINCVSSGGGVNNFQVQPVGDQMPIGTTIKMCRDPASNPAQTLSLTYGSTTMVNIGSGDANKVYTFTKVNANGNINDWVQLTSA